LIELLIFFIRTAVSLYFWVIVVTVALSWLIGLNIVNGYRPEVRAVQRFCWQLTEPLLRPIRERLPPLGGMDLSPVVLLLGLQLLEILIIKLLTEPLV